MKFRQYKIKLIILNNKKLQSIRIKAFFKKENNL